MTGRSRVVQGPLSVYAAGFREELVLLGYSAGAAAEHVRLLGDLSAWLAREHVAAGGLTAGQMARFLGGRTRRGHRGLTTAAGAAPLLEYLIVLGVVPAPARVVPGGPAGALLERYRRYLVSQRGLSDREVARHLAVARLFAESSGSGELDWAAVTAGDVTRFVVQQCSARSRPAACKLVSELRSLLRFAQMEGWTAAALSQAVPPVAAWSASSLPRWVAPEQVAALLAGCDRQTAPGRRDFAILVLLARLGLRAGEVAAMQLGDIDWRAGEAVVHGKGRREEKLPLPQDVGEALTDYLQHGRPRAASRSVFLRVRAPLRGLTPQGVSCVVYGASQRAGLRPIGAHRLRHTAATEMLRAGASLTEVGQVLRQRAAGTTAIYAKVDHNALRALARPWPGGAA
jgi:site-specific recombinase XerD